MWLVCESDFFFLRTIRLFWPKSLNLVLFYSVKKQVSPNFLNRKFVINMYDMDQ